MTFLTFLFDIIDIWHFFKDRSIKVSQWLGEQIVLLNCISNSVVVVISLDAENRTIVILVLVSTSNRTS